MRWNDAGNGEERGGGGGVCVCVCGWVLSWVNLISPDSHVATTSYPTSESKQTQPQQAVVTPAAHRGAQDSICFPQCEPQHFRVSRPRRDASKSFLLFPFWGHRSKLTHMFTLTLVINSRVPSWLNRGNHPGQTGGAGDEEGEAFKKSCDAAAVHTQRACVGESLSLA